MNKLFIIFFILTGIYLNAQTNHIVQVSNFQFTPASLTVSLGDTVTWQWIQGTHTTTSDSTSGTNSWNSPISSSNKTFSFVLNATGLHRYYCIPHGGPGGSGMSGTIQVENAVSVGAENEFVSNYLLYQNYPNPFNPTTTIMLNMPVSGETRITLYNNLGQKIDQMFSGHLESGLHSFTFNGVLNRSGIYFYKAESRGDDGSLFSQTRKMILLK